MHKPKILWISDNPYLNFVGQSIVTRQVLSGLIDKYEIHVLGFSEVKDDRISIKEELPYQVYTTQRYDDKSILETCERIHPDIVVMSHDAFLFPTIKNIKNQIPSIKFIGYFTIDGDPLPMIYRSILGSCDMLVSPTNYGKKVLNDQFFDYVTEVIPYGIDHKHYFKRDDRSNIIQELKNYEVPFSPYVNDKLSHDEVFVATFWGHNQSKKNIGAIVDSWKKANLPRNRSHLIIVTHSNLYKKGQIQIIGDYDYRNTVADSLDYISVIDSMFPDEVMSRIVQLGNTVLFPSVGEGFGMPLSEAQACGAVPITTNYAGATDFCRHGENALLVGGELVFGEMGIRRIIASIDDMKDRIKWLYDSFQNKDLKKELPGEYGPSMFQGRNSNSNKSVCWSELSSSAINTASQYKWSDCSNKFDVLFNKVLNNNFNSRFVHARL